MFNNGTIKMSYKIGNTLAGTRVGRNINIHHLYIFSDHSSVKTSSAIYIALNIS